MNNGLKVILAAVLIGGAAAALPALAKPKQQTKVEPDPAAEDGFCEIYGTGYHRIPGTDTCVKVGGHVQATFDAGGNRR